MGSGIECKNILRDKDIIDNKKRRASNLILVGGTDAILSLSFLTISCQPNI